MLSVNGSPLFFVRDECLANVLEQRQVVETADFIPGLGGQPRSRVAVRIVETNASRQQEAPFIVVDLLVVFENVDAQQEREQQLSQN
jgi:hypothetical protein